MIKQNRRKVSVIVFAVFALLFSTITIQASEYGPFTALLTHVENIGSYEFTADVDQTRRRPRLRGKNSRIPRPFARLWLAYWGWAATLGHGGESGSSELPDAGDSRRSARSSASARRSASR